MKKTYLMASVSALAMTMAVCSREAVGNDVYLSDQQGGFWFYDNPVDVLARNIVDMAYLRYKIAKRQVVIDGLEALQSETAND